MFILFSVRSGMVALDSLALQYSITHFLNSNPQQSHRNVVAAVTEAVRSEVTVHRGYSLTVTAARGLSICNDFLVCPNNVTR